MEPLSGADPAHRLFGVARNTTSEEAYGVMPALYGPSTDEQEFESVKRLRLGQLIS